MKQLQITIDSIFEGQSPSSNFAQEGQFLTSVAIDPEAPNTDAATDLKPSGFIRPIAYEKFSSSALDQVPLWIITDPKDTTVYVYGNVGDLVTYDSSLDERDTEIAVELTVTGTDEVKAVQTLTVSGTELAGGEDPDSANVVLPTHAGGTDNVAVNVADGDTNAEIAEAIKTAINAHGDWVATRAVAVVTATAAAFGTEENTLIDADLLIIEINDAKRSENLLRAVGTSKGNGAAYYSNYIYYARNGDVGRYGPLDDTPGFTDDFWTGTLGLAALTNTTYPTTRHSIEFPNHVMKAHSGDNKLYFADIYNGRGILSAIKTSKTTYQGDTDDGSAYNVLDFPFDYKPMCIESYGTNLAIGCSFGTSSVVNQGASALFIWDTGTSVEGVYTFNRIISIPDQIITALKYQNGILYGWSGNLSGGTRFWVYLGGDSIQTLKYIPDAIPPLPGAIEADANRIMWGGFTVYPVASASVFAYGSKSDLFPRGLHNIAKSTVTATATNGIVTTLKNVIQNNKPHPNLVIGATDGTNTNLDKRSATYQTSVFRSRSFEIGRPFTIDRIRIPLTQAVAANMTITPKLYFDAESDDSTGTIINDTNYPDSNKFIILGHENFNNKVSGQNSFFIEFTMSGTALSTIGLPIEIELTVDDKD